MKHLAIALLVGLVAAPAAYACDIFSSSAVNCNVVAVNNHHVAVNNHVGVRSFVQAVPVAHVVPVAVNNHHVFNTAVVASVHPVVRVQTFAVQNHCVNVAKVRVNNACSANRVNVRVNSGRRSGILGLGRRR